MILRHRKRTGYIIEKGFMGREKKVEKEYYYEEHLGVLPLAAHALGEKLFPGDYTHTGKEVNSFANIVEKHHDAAGYDAFHVSAKKIIYNYLKDDPLSHNMVLWMLSRFGRRDGEGYVKTVGADDPSLADEPIHTLVYYKPYEEFYSKHKKEFIDSMVENIKYTLGRELTKEEEQKLRRGLELAFEYGKRFHDIYKRVDEQKYHATGETSERYRKAGFHSVQYAEKTIGVDFLEKVGDIILELNKLFPVFSKPEEVYGDRWYEFLKKKGIDPSELNPEKKKSKTTAPSRSLTLAARELLGLLSGLRLAGYSENALENLRRELEKRIDGLIENPGENLELIGLYTAVLKLAEKGEIEKAEEFLRGL